MIFERVGGTRTLENHDLFTTTNLASDETIQDGAMIGKADN